MKRLIWAVMIVGSLYIPAFSQDRPITPAEAEAAKGVLETVSRWGDAVKDGNTKMLDILFRDDLVITTFDGRVRGKAEELDIINPSENARTTAVANENLVVRIYGNTAIVTGLAKMEFLSNGKPSKTAFRYTAVFVKEDKGWQLAALHTARPQGSER